MSAKWKIFLKGKKVTQVGLGLLGRGVGDAEFLAECRTQLIVTDLKNEKELAPSLERLKKFENITYHLGEHRLEDFSAKGPQAPDFILKAAGVPLDSPFIAEARKHNIPIEMDASLFLKLAPKVISIGVTGTRGKTTTTMLIYELVKAHLNPAKQKVFLAGNIRDTAALPLLREVCEKDIVIFELDSWQLQGFGDSKISPHIAVFTNFMDDHLVYYRDNRERYFEDKANIFLYQKQNDYLVTGEKVAQFITAKYVQEREVGGRMYHAPSAVSSEGIPHDWKIKLLGEHNRDNIALAISVAKILGISYETIKSVVESFSGVEGRLQFLREYNGVRIYNDNSATTPDATIAALGTLGNLVFKVETKFPSEKKLILIMGGTDKGLDMNRLIEEIGKRCKGVVLLNESGTEKIKNNIKSLKGLTVKAYDTLPECVQAAVSLSRKGDVIVFSPAFASFGKWFKNEYDRSDQFVKIVSQL